MLAERHQQRDVAVAGAAHHSILPLIQPRKRFRQA
jgi:hypothetical protein